jgi:hypothetical protein
VCLTVLGFLIPVWLQHIFLPPYYVTRPPDAHLPSVSGATGALLLLS